MKPLTHEWVAKAEGDFAMVEREARARKSPNYDGRCFHAQQCVEKYLLQQIKGWNWQHTNILPPEDMQGLFETWGAIVASGEPGEIQARMRRFDDE